MNRSSGSRWSALVGVLLVGTAIADAAPDKLVIVADGRSHYEIVVGRGALSTTRLAGDELRKYVRRATGVTLPIVRRPSSGLNQIYISATQELKPNGFAIQAHDGNIYIRGRDSSGTGGRVDYHAPVFRGTCNGVYTFLERFVGVRWYWGDELGEIVPRARRVRVPVDLEIKEEPHFEYRALAYGPPESFHGSWARHNRLGADLTMIHGHALHKIVPVDVWARRGHPEYAAMTGGKRRIGGSGRWSGGHVCMGNPEVVALVAEAAIVFFRSHPDVQMFSISPPDGSGMCRDALCEALDDLSYRIPWGPRKKRYPVLTDRVLKFYNAVAEIVAKEFPDRLLGAYLYMDYRYPPRHVKRVHPMLALVLNPYLACESWDEERWRLDKSLFEFWGSFHDRVYAYEIFYESRRNFGLPAPSGRRLTDYLKLFDESGMRGCYLYIGPTWESTGAEAYVLARWLWDPAVNVEAIKREYYGVLYQRAAPAVRAYFKTAGECLKRAWSCDQDLVDQLRKEVFHRVRRSSPEGLTRLYIGYEGAIDELERHVVRAERLAAGDEMVMRRVARLRDNFTLTASTIRALRSVVAYERDPRKDVSHLRPLVAAVRTRELLFKRISRGYGSRLVKSMRWADERDDLPMRFGGYYHTLASGSGK
jgi:Domain of unknown function (DUF4838)